ncbi:hydroxyethylthiazole kinase [Paludibacterium purpuratum]|uniref:Hydroxyethylthiazole kinase n=1 Tax=Paludibacterium purpuratum TaxID=1144873 RepID=A0A4R7B328_9NEIS|nr:hydroxyethylthiazole kinase [Paludibacterium purpuratum]TDR77941.1 hydroxyethylthiazole kinase [Paludibacterium purpuratum]
MNRPTALSGRQAAADLERLRAAQPLVHCLTNNVVSAFTANVLLALGAAPAMVVAPEEAAPFAAIAGALLVNVGTLTVEQASAMRAAVASARQAGTPWTLDPVAVGVLAWRTAFCHELLVQRPRAIRGNASEIMALAGVAAGGRGVDSLVGSEQALDAAMQLAERCGAVVAVTGATDFITDGHQVLAVDGGDARLQQVTGTGCSLSAMVAAFTACHPDPLQAVASACALMKLAGETAARESRGPGSFAVALLDALAQLDGAALTARWP